MQKEKNGRQRWLGPLTGGMDPLMALETARKSEITKPGGIPFERKSVSIASTSRRDGTVYVGNPSGHKLST